MPVLSPTQTQTANGVPLYVPSDGEGNALVSGNLTVDGAVTSAGDILSLASIRGVNAVTAGTVTGGGANYISLQPTAQGGTIVARSGVLAGQIDFALGTNIINAGLPFSSPAFISQRILFVSGSDGVHEVPANGADGVNLTNSAFYGIVSVLPSTPTNSQYVHTSLVANYSPSGFKTWTAYNTIGNATIGFNNNNSGATTMVISGLSPTTGYSLILTKFNTQPL